LIELNTALYQVSCAGERLSVTSAGCKLSLGGRLYETHTSSVNGDHSGIITHQPTLLCARSTELTVPQVSTAAFSRTF